MIDPLRHMSVFPPYAFGDKRVDVIGCGATGSRIALSLAKLGVQNLHIWDFDIVEEHNIANQVFGIPDIGKLKGEALAELILTQTASTVTFHNEKVDGTQALGEIVFILTDTMSSRKAIWDKLKYKINTRLVIETRMGTDSGRVYSVSPNKPSHIKEYEGTLYADEEAEVSACGASTSVGPTAEIISGLAVWQLIRWFSIEQGTEDKLEEEIIISTRPSMILSRNF